MENNGELRTDWFRMPSHLFVLAVILLYGKVWIILLSSFVLIGLAAGIIIDIRYAVIACMVLFLVLPVALLLIYLYYGLKESCYFNITMHSITVKDEDIEVLMKWNKAIEGEEDDMESVEATRSILLKRNSFSTPLILKNSILLKMNFNFGFIWLPVSAFEKEVDFINFVNKIKA